MGCFGVFAEITSLLLCIGAIVTNSLLLLSCDLWKVESLLFEGSLGLFSWQIPGQHAECTSIEASDGEEKDFYEGQILLCARWSGVAALSLGVGMTLLILFRQYLVPCPCTALLRDIGAIGTQICLGLVYTTYFSRVCIDFECHYGEGTLWLIITQSLWAVGGVLSLCMRPGRYERARQQQQQQHPESSGTKSSPQAENDENAADEEARDTVGGLEAGLAKYQDNKQDQDGGMSETSSMVVGMSVNPEEEERTNGTRLEQTTGMAATQKEMERREISHI